MPEPEIKSWFPNAEKEGFKITSSETPEYNCIAWAGANAIQKWDPNDIPGRFWPTGLVRDKKVSTFIKLYEICGGYEPCEENNSKLEPEYEKIAIFCILDPSTMEKEVSHAARQISSGKWTSKLGDFEDIEHDTLHAIEGSWYGTVAKILKRSVLQRNLF